MKKVPHLALLSILGVLAGNVTAGPFSGASQHQLAQSDASISKSKAADIARSKYGGKVLKVEEVKKEDKTLYRVKLLLDGGRVKIVTISGNNGKVI